MRAKTILMLALVSMLVASLVGSSGLAAAPAEKVDVLIGFRVRPGPAEQALVRGVGGEVYWQFSIVKALAARISPRAAEALARDPRVTYVEPDGLLHAHQQAVPWGIDRVFGDEEYSFPTWAGSTGDGIGVAVLDTGISTSHPDLNVAGGRHFYTITTGPPQSRLREDGNYEDGHGHGTHVAGTIAALDNDYGVVGAAPNVVLYAVKVLDDSGSGSVSAIAAGIEWAVSNGIPVLNMSLGSSTFSQTLKDACDAAYAAGHLVVSSAGNEGNADGTGDNVGYPAKYDSVIAVAASDINDQRASFSSTGPTVELIAPGVDVLSTIPWTDENSLTVDGVSYKANYIENAARTSELGVTAEVVDGGRATGANPAWNGKVVLVERGDISFYDKVMNVQSSGGVAAVIYNNEPGNFFGTLGDGYSSSIPAVSLSQEDGQWLVANKIGASGAVVSLYDPNMPGYTSWSGTSMASPHVAGVAALVWAADPSLTNVQIRAILQETADDLGLPAAHQGRGLVRADLAVRAVGEVEPPPPLQEYVLSVSSTAGGSVSNPGEGTFTFEEGTVVELVAVAESRYVFIEWIGDSGTIANVNAGSTTITMNGDYMITATFAEAAVGNVVRVGSITYATRGGRLNDKHLDVTLFLLDNLDHPVTGASVSATLYGNGAWWSFQGTTSSSGTVTFSLLNHKSGCYYAVVTAVLASGLEWDGMTPENGYCK
jgi:serine protease